MEMLSQYTIAELVIYTSVLVGIIIGAIKACSYLNDKYQLFLTKKVREAKRDEEIDECRKETREKVENLTSLVNVLLESDKCRIRSEIVREHDKFMALGCIDNYSLDCLTKQFECYKAMGGNSYVKKLMEDLSNLKGKEE